MSEQRKDIALSKTFALSGEIFRFGQFTGVLNVKERLGIPDIEAIVSSVEVIPGVQEVYRVRATLPADAIPVIDWPEYAITPSGDVWRVAQDRRPCRVAR